jgi:ketosteroid isomerase-like protein
MRDNCLLHVSFPYSLVFMRAENNKNLLRDIFERMSQGDTRALSEAMSDDFRWEFPGNWSWSGTWEPKQVVIDGLLRPLMAQFSHYRAEAALIIAEGDRVVVQARVCHDHPRRALSAKLLFHFPRRRWKTHRSDRTLRHRIGGTSSRSADTVADRRVTGTGVPACPSRQVDEIPGGVPMVFVKLLRPPGVR